MDREAIKAHVLSFEDEDALWAHLLDAHGVEGQGDMVELDDRHIQAHKNEDR